MTQKKTVVINVSARHVHLSQEHVEALFGPGYRLTPVKDLGQPGQFACDEQVAVIGPKGSFGKVRILGPARSATQVEISMTDSRTLGVQGVVRQSGNIAGTPGIILEGPKGRIELSQGVIVAARHVHMTPADAEKYGVKDGTIVRVKTTAGRPLTFDDVICRVTATSALEMHVDTDEANAAGLKDGDIGEILN